MRDPILLRCTTNARLSTISIWYYFGDEGRVADAAGAVRIKLILRERLNIIPNTSG